MSVHLRARSSLGLGDLDRGARGAVVFSALALALTTSVALVLSDGNLALALAPALLVAGLFLLSRIPVGGLAFMFFAAALLFDNPSEQPGMGVFKTALTAPGALIYNALEKTLNVPGLKVFGIEVLLFGVFLARVLTTPRAADHERLPRVYTVAAMATLVVVVGLEVWGIARGGDVRFSMLQFRPLLFVATFPLVYASCMADRRQAGALLVSIVVIAVIRALFGIQAWVTVLQFGIKGEEGLGGGGYVMTHSDSILSAVALSLLFTWTVMAPSIKSVFFSTSAGAIIFAGMVINNRRIAYVSLAGAIALLVLFGDPTFRRRMVRMIRLSIPALIAYVIVGWNGRGSWAKPVQVLKSVFESSDASAQTRDIENYNLLLTTKGHPIFGSGFGHEYIEQVVAYDISHSFEAYRYVPHNSVLWLFSAAGVVGYTLFFALSLVSLFFAFRVLAKNATLTERLLASSTVSSVVAYGMQGWGDMGLGSWMGALIIGAHFSVLAHVARRHDVMNEFDSSDSADGHGRAPMGAVS